MHGYELRERLERGLGELWRVATSQLYSVLHRLEREGWARPHVEARSARPSRTVYRITPEGAAVFARWVGAPVEHLRDVRVEFLAKVFFARRRGRTAVLDLIDRQVETLKALESGLASRGRIDSDDAGFGRIVSSFRSHRMQSMITWLEENRESLSETEDEE